MKVTDFANATQRDIAKTRVLQALQVLKDELGISFENGGGSYSDTEFTLKIRMNVLANDGKVVVSDHDKRMLEMVGCPLGTTFIHGGRRLTVVGYDGAKPKNCIKIEDQFGKGMICSPSLVKHSTKVS